MLTETLLWLIIVQFSFKGCLCSNSTQKPTEVFPNSGITFPVEKASVPEEIASPARNVTETTVASIQNHALSEKISLNSTNVNQTDLEVVKIFHGEVNITSAVPREQISVNSTGITDHLNASLVNSSSVVQSWNETFKTNYSTLAEAVESSENVLPFRLPNSAAIAAGVCLVSAVIGYISCVSYRRFLQRKYGNSQILIGEDVYDTSDLRNFEI